MKICKLVQYLDALLCTGYLKHKMERLNQLHVLSGICLSSSVFVANGVERRCQNLIYARVLARGCCFKVLSLVECESFGTIATEHGCRLITAVSLQC